MTPFKKLFVMLSIAFGMAVAFTFQASAQTAGKIIIFDLSRVQEESLVGQHVISQLTQYGNAVQARKDALETDLNKQGSDLQGKQSILPQDEFQRQVDDFNKKTRQAETELQGYRQNMVRAQQSAKLEIESHLRPILNKIMTEKGADIVLDKSLIYMNGAGFDVTDLVIQRLNTELTTYPLNLTPPGLDGPAAPATKK